MNFVILIFNTISLLKLTEAAHFRGGTISWKPIRDQTIEFKFKMGWTYGSGPGCTNSYIGEFVNTSFVGDKVWKCTSGCDLMQKKEVGTVYYYCTAASTVGTADEKWEQGENSFQQVFVGNGPFTVSYTGAMWMNLNFGNPNGWNLQTTVDLRIRDDINATNSSPLTVSKPLYTLQFACYNELKIPMYDPNGDRVKCRWARGEECDSVCHAVPSGELDENTCTFKFNATSNSKYQQDGWYAVALTMEDFPTKTIRVGNQTYTKDMAMSTVPLQFLIHLVGKPSPCNWKPEFVSPTPSSGTTISVPASKSFSRTIYAANLANKNESVTTLTLTRPAGMVLTGPQPDPGRNGVFYWNLTWTPAVSDKGAHIVCGMAEDSSGHTSDSLCFTIIAWDSPVDPCSSNPCRGNQMCVRIGSSQNIKCSCPVGFVTSGSNCYRETPASTTSTIRRTTPPTTTRTTRAMSKTVSTSTITHRLSLPVASRAVGENRTTAHVGGTNTTVKQGLNSQIAKMNQGQTTAVSKGITEKLVDISKSDNCFRSSPVVVFTIFIIILIVALVVVAAILIYKIRHLQEELKSKEFLNDTYSLAK